MKVAYVYYDNEGNIKGLSPVPNKDLQIHNELEVKWEIVEPLLSGKERTRKWQVIVDETPRLEKKKDYTFGNVGQRFNELVKPFEVKNKQIEKADININISYEENKVIFVIMHEKLLDHSLFICKKDNYLKVVERVDLNVLNFHQIKLPNADYSIYTENENYTYNVEIKEYEHTR